jgi:hypothetical protein
MERRKFTREFKLKSVSSEPGAGQSDYSPSPRERSTV